MPYDNPRPEDTSRGPVTIDAPISRVAPKGKFRILARDTKSGKEWVEDDVPGTPEQVLEIARELVKGQAHLQLIIYDDQRRFVACTSISS